MCEAHFFIRFDITPVVCHEVGVVYTLLLFLLLLLLNFFLGGGGGGGGTGKYTKTSTLSYLFTP